MWNDLTQSNQDDKPSGIFQNYESLKQGTKIPVKFSSRITSQENEYQKRLFI